MQGGEDFMLSIPDRSDTLFREHLGSTAAVDGNNNNGIRPAGGRIFSLNSFAAGNRSGELRLHRYTLEEEYAAKKIKRMLLRRLRKRNSGASVAVSLFVFS